MNEKHVIFQSAGIGNRIKRVRKWARESQQVFADALGVDRSHISKIETNTAKPSEQLLKSICRTYGIREEWLKSEQGPAREHETATLTEKSGIQSSTNFSKEVLICLHHVSSLNKELEIIERDHLYLLPSFKKYFSHEDIVVEFRRRLNNLQKSISSILSKFK